MSAKKMLVRVDSRDERVQREAKAALKEMPGVRQVNGEGGRADVCLCHLQDGLEADLVRMRRIVEQGEASEIFATAVSPDPELLIKAMRMGIKEFLPLPVNKEDLFQALERHRRRGVGEAGSGALGGKVVSVLGAKGGVGTTTLAVNLAMELNAAKPGGCAVLDMGRPMGEVPFFLDLEYGYTLGDVTDNISRLDATYLQSVMAEHSSGLKVLPAPGPDWAGEEQGERLGPILAEMRSLYDHVLVDESGVLDDLSLKVVECSDEVLVAMALSLPCLARVRAVVERIQDHCPGVKVSLVVNRHMSDSEIELAEAEDILGRKVEWMVPNDYAASLAAINQGVPLVQGFPKSPAAKALRKLARRLGAVKAAPAASGGRSIFGLFRRGRAGFCPA